MRLLFSGAHLVKCKIQYRIFGIFVLRRCNTRSMAIVADFNGKVVSGMECLTTCPDNQNLARKSKSRTKLQKILKSPAHADENNMKQLIKSQ